MIVLNISCYECRHDFEGWFSSSSSCNSQIKKKLVECTYCGSTNVEKGLSSPNIAVHKDRNVKKNKVIKELKSKILEMQNFVKKNADYVGDKFTYEARRIHYDKTKNKSIYGHATKEDVKELNEEGIEVATIPWISKKEN